MRKQEILVHSLVNGEQSRSERRAVFAFSTGIQAALIGAMVLAPLLATGELPRLMRLTPNVPWRGRPLAKQQTPSGKTAAPRAQTKLPAEGKIFQPPVIPNKPLVLDDRAGESGAPIGQGEFPGLPEGLVPSPGLVDPRSAARPPQPAAPESRPRVIRVSEGVQQGRLIHRVQPEYPVLAKQLRLEGTVEIRAIIGRDGAVHSLELVSGHPFLARAALDAVAQWRYLPTMLNAQAVDVETRITVVFTLQR